MISQRILREWSNEAVKYFQSVMPAIEAPYPEIHIVSYRTMYSVREAEVKRTQTPAVNRYDIPAMETLHGPGGDSILVYQKGYNGVMWDPKYPDAKRRYQHFLWHEHGHFYALSAEDPTDNFIRFMDQNLHLDEYYAQLGYSFWSEFIAEVIACRVTPDPIIDWEHFDYYPTRNELSRLLNGAFNTNGLEVSWYDLAFYFAKRLTDKTTVGFIDAAQKGIVKTRRPRGIGFESVTFEEAGIDPAALDGLNPQFHKYMADLQVYMESIISEEQYWKVSLEELDIIGRIISCMDQLIVNNEPSVRLRDRVFR